jgi:putative beta-lysine N-acetyltransferase
MRLNTDDTQTLISILDDLALKNSCGKILAKIPAPVWNDFKSAGYVKEAVVPKFFKGQTSGFFIAKYLSAERQKDESVKGLLNLVHQTPVGSINNKHRKSRVVRDVVPCKLSDAKEMSVIYQQVFESYPFPIQDPAYLERIMIKGALYFCLRVEREIVAISAIEIDSENKNAEMTDFATLPKWQGMGFAGMLLKHMDKEVRKLGIKTAYTIARAESHGMNLVFKNNGYNYAGILRNNSNICGNIQSMTVWYKHL